MKQNGFALVSVIIAFIIISLMGAFLTNLISRGSFKAQQKMKNVKAIYASHAVAETVLKKKIFGSYSTLFDNCRVNSTYLNITSNVYGLSITSNCENVSYKKYMKLNLYGQVMTRVGSFIKSNTTGNQIVTGIGFQPKALIFYWTRQTATGFSADVNAGFGLATYYNNSVQQSAVSVTMRNNANKSDQGRRFSVSNCIIFLDRGGPPTLRARAEFVSFNSDGFTINWLTNVTDSYIVNYIAIGGDIIARAGNFNLTTATGTQTVTGVGFQPDFVLFNWSHAGSFDTNIARSSFGIGYAKSASEQGALTQAGSDNEGNNDDKRWQQRTNSCILILTTANPPAQDAIVAFDTFNTNGFSINKTDPPSTTIPIFYLAIKGGTHKVGFFNQPNTNISQTISGVGFKSKLLKFISFNLLANPNILSNGGVSIGSATSVNQTSIWYQDRANEDERSDANMYYSNNRTLTLAFSTSLTGQANLTGIFDDQFVLNWTNCDGTQRQIIYWAMGDSLTPSFKIIEEYELF